MRARESKSKKHKKNDKGRRVEGKEGKLSTKIRVLHSLAHFVGITTDLLSPVLYCLRTWKRKFNFCPRIKFIRVFLFMKA